MAPVAKYFKIKDVEAADERQDLLPSVILEAGASRLERKNRPSPWNAECITRLLYLFVMTMVAIGFMIRYLPERLHSGHDHHHHNGQQLVQSHNEEEHHQVYRSAAVAAGQLECSVVGKDILKAGGNAVDAAIAATLCQGVVEPYFSGLGGGAIMTIYNATTQKVTCISSREKAPASASRDMFMHSDGSARGPKFIAVPGELRGLAYAYNKYGGRLKWADLFEPAISKARDGFKVSGSMADKLKELYEDVIVKETDSVFCDVYCNEDRTGVKKEGDVVKNPLLAKTLTKIQEEGVDVFFNGEMAQAMINEIQERGGIMTMQDLQSFNVTEYPAIEVKLRNTGIQSTYTIHAPPLPLGGPVFGAILSIMDLFAVTPAEYQKNATLQWHRTDEAFRHAYGIRYSMGDPKYASGTYKIVNKITSGAFASAAKKRIFDDKTFHDPKYYGARFYNPGKSSTSHVSVLAPNKDAVAVTSTINYHWGSYIMSPSTGVVFNNEMDDFSYPNGDPDHDAHMSPENQIEGGKEPLSSMSPVIFSDDKKDPVFIIGAAGGIHIPTSIAQVMLRLLYFGAHDFDEPFREKRLHDHLVPDVLEYEEGFDPTVVENLKKMGHNMIPMEPSSHVNGIKYHVSHIHAFSDLRNKGAGTSGW